MLWHVRSKSRVKLIEAALQKWRSWPYSKIKENSVGQTHQGITKRKNLQNLLV